MLLLDDSPAELFMDDADDVLLTARLVVVALDDTASAEASALEAVDDAGGVTPADAAPRSAPGRGAGTGVFPEEETDVAAALERCSISCWR